MAWNTRWAQRLLAAGGGSGAAAGGGGLDFLLVAGMHTLLNFTAHSAGILAAAHGTGVAVLAAAPFNSGVLARDPATGFDGAWYSCA